MKLDVTQKILDIRGKEMRVDESHDLAPAGRVLVLDGKELSILDGDLDGRIVLIDGKPRMKGGEPRTLGRSILDALVAGMKGDEELSGPKKSELGDLADRVYVATYKEFLPVELSPTEAETVLKRCEKYYLTEIYWRIDKMVAEAKAQKVDKPKLVEKAASS